MTTKILIHIDLAEDIESTTLLCDTDYGAVCHDPAQGWDNLKNLVHYPLTEEEELCPKCLNHPNYPLHVLAVVDE